MIEGVVGNDPDRARAIIRTKTGRNNLRFSVRELPDRRSAAQRASDAKRIVLWTMNGWVHRAARFDLAAAASSDSEISEDAAEASEDAHE